MVQSELINYTAGADIGVSLIENISKSYYYALPNKLFEYIMSNIPVLISDLPQMKKIVDDYNVGRYVTLEDKSSLEKVLSEMLNESNSIEQYKINAEKASKELNWQKEFEKVKYLFIG
jgi:glycosyltransferase involved in cell wall biosynthesis